MNMKKLINTLLAAAALLSVQSCTFVKFNSQGESLIAGSLKAGPGSITETHKVADFTKVISNLSGDIVYHITDAGASVVITAPENYHEYIICEVKGGRLSLSVKDDKRLSPKNIKIELASPTLTDMEINGAAQLSIPDRLETESFFLTIRGAADADISDIKCGEAGVTIQGAGDVDVSHLEADHIHCLIQGAGDIKLSGEAESGKFIIQGAGDMDIDDLKVENIETNIKGLSRKTKTKSITF